MALHMIRSTPNFTKAMRGYDIEEVDDYVDALRETEDETAQVLAATEATNTALTAEMDRLQARISELEACIRSETPRSIAALGERLTLVLEEAEAGAQATMRAATEEAESLLAEARSASEEERLSSSARAADAEQKAAARVRSADEQAIITEASARHRAEAIIADAESRALARRREIEAWVERVRAHIEGEEARAAEEFARVRALRIADLGGLERRREAMLASLVDMAEGLRSTVVAARTATGDITPERAPIEAGPTSDGPAAITGPTVDAAAPDASADDATADATVLEHPADDHTAGHQGAGTSITAEADVTGEHAAVATDQAAVIALTSDAGAAPRH